MRYFPPIAIVLILTGLYAHTIAPDLTWSHFSADGGDLISAVVTGGVPHPTGYPLYLILARIFLWLPFGGPAFRTNLFSAVCSVFTALLLHEYLLRQLRDTPFRPWTAWLSALAYGVAPLVWGQALVTEVYALHGLLMVSCLFILNAPLSKFDDWVKGLLFGLAASNHLTSVLMFPLLAMGDAGRFDLHPARFFKRLLGVLCGLAPYALLPLRSAFMSPVNWGHAYTVDGFIWLVSGKLYHTYPFSLALTDILSRFRAFAGLLLEQYTWLGVLLGIFGLLIPIPRRVLMPTLWMSISFLAYAINYGSFDAQVYLLPVWLAFAVWLAFGIQALLSSFLDKRWHVAVAVMLSLTMILRISSVYKTVDVSEDFTALDFLHVANQDIPQNALVFVEGDGHIFSLWYMQYVLGQRHDLAVIATGLLPFEWYLEDLGQWNQFLILPQNTPVLPFDIMSANPRRAVCFIGYDESIDCR